MEICDVEDVLARAEPADPLRLCPLAILDPRREPYQAMLFQPGGTIHASHVRIGNADPVAASPMYIALLREAIARQSQLVVTPEYSLPWSVVDQIVQGPLRPPVGSLWALGSESITPDALEVLHRSLPGDARLFHEPFDATKRAQQAFIDPLLYCFWARTAADAHVLCLLVQFKTVPCRDDDHVELRALYLGTRAYRFRNDAQSIRFIGIICSDAFEFDNALVDANCSNAIILHIQLNKSPGNPNYSAYRSRLYATASNMRVEVLALNWSANLQLESGAAWNEIAGTAWYVSPGGGQPNDAEVNELHKAGVYYSLVDTRWHGFYLNYSPHFLVLEKQRVFASGAQVLAPRLAPRVLCRRVWSAQTNSWVDASADDGFGTFLQPYVPLDATLPKMSERDPLSVERALELLEGADGSPSDWYALWELRAFRVADEESLRRLTVSQESNRFRAGVQFRRERVRKAKIAAEFPGQPVPWPGGAADLARGFKYRWLSDDPHCNVEPLDGGLGPATLVYLGEEPDEDALSSVYEKLRKALRWHVTQKRLAGDTNADPSKATDRLCVTYRRGQALYVHRPRDWGSITDPVLEAEDDIAKGEA